MPYYTPLRYPGGKRRLVTTITRLLEANDLKDIEYCETYAGGAAIALALLMEEHASKIHINDLSRAVYAFWYTILNDNAELCRKVEKAKLTMKEWRKQRAIYDLRETPDLTELGFATLYLNRTNRSGYFLAG
jgi:DNA adenine methylase